MPRIGTGSSCRKKSSLLAVSPPRPVRVEIEVSQTERGDESLPRRTAQQRAFVSEADAEEVGFGAKRAGHELYAVEDDRLMQGRPTV